MVGGILPPPPCGGPLAQGFHHGSQRGFREGSHPIHFENRPPCEQGQQQGQGDPQEGDRLQRRAKVLECRNEAPLGFYPGSLESLGPGSPTKHSQRNQGWARQIFLMLHGERRMSRCSGGLMTRANPRSQSSWQFSCLQQIGSLRGFALGCRTSWHGAAFGLQLQRSAVTSAVPAAAGQTARACVCTIHVVSHDATNAMAQQLQARANNTFLRAGGGAEAQILSQLADTHTHTHIPSVRCLVGKQVRSLFWRVYVRNWCELSRR